MTERGREEAHLKECVRIIRNNLAYYEEEVRTLGAKIQEMYEQYRDHDPEIFTQLANAITMYDSMKSALAHNTRALAKAYFGRVDISGDDGEETLYIGKGGVMKDSLTIIVTDWRAPIANVYYENGLGRCTYKSPYGEQIEVELKKKRTYEVDYDRLIDYYDTEVIANDELLTKYLARNKEAVLGEIIATIQKEQNDIIRKTPYHNIIVQGVAGSGKTTVAMHRISYILYNYGKDFRTEDFYIIGSNRMLLNYITGVLPELDVNGVRQMTMEQLFVRLLYEDWKDGGNKIIQVDEHSHIKGKKEWFERLRRFCECLEEKTISAADVIFDGEVIYTAEQIKRYRDESRALSIQSKINGLNERVMARLKNVITGKEITYPEHERKKIMGKYRQYFGKRVWKGSIYRLYEEFLNEQTEGVGGQVGEVGGRAEGSGNQAERRINTARWLANVKNKKFDLYDLAALAYLYKRVKETDRIREASHIVVDEAQDFGMMAYEVLRFCIPDCSWTVMGDVSQNIHFGFGLNDWEELKSLLITGEYDSFNLLKKSYRNTVEISEFAQSILKQGTYQAYPTEPVIRHGKTVRVMACGSGQANAKYEIGYESETECQYSMTETTKSVLTELKLQGYDTIAIICRNEAQADYVGMELADCDGVTAWSTETMEYEKGIMILPVNYTKGLEFDAVIIYNPTPRDYPKDDGHAKLLYVAATRALHELVVIYEDEVTELIKDLSDCSYEPK